MIAMLSVFAMTSLTDSAGEEGIKFEHMTLADAKKKP